MANTEVRTNFDGIAAETGAIIKKPPLWGSARLTYTICAFLAMVVQLCLRNTLNFVILCMVKPQHEEPENSTAFIVKGIDSSCGLVDIGNGTLVDADGKLLWSRSEEFALLGKFYYGYLITLPIAGRLADKFGGKIFFVHSITIQAVIFMLLPFFAQKYYVGAVIIRVTQGLVAGFSNPALYQLFSTWAHPNERTAFLSFAYGGYSVGALVVFPLSSFLCKFGWECAFYVVGSVSLLFGICCQWLVYSTLEDHPRLSKDEYDYLNENRAEKSKMAVPWKSILTSVPVYAFIFTHIFHTYGIMVLVIMMPTFFREAMRLPLDMVGFASSAPFLGGVISKVITIITCPIIEQLPNLNLTIYRRIVYVICNCVTILFITGIIFCTCDQTALVVILAVCVGISTDMAFTGAYWPSMLYVAPSFSGLIAGMGNCLATVSGFLAPLLVSALVLHGTKDEWNLVMASLMTSYILGAIVYGLFGSSKLTKWGKVAKSENTNNNNNST